MSRGFDHATMARAFSYPGIDPRHWMVNAIVDPETPEAPSVRFKDDEGNPLPTGPLVSCTLQPSGVPVVCRVSSFIAGNGEGTWFPIQQGDEVLVALPNGVENGSPTIIGRLNQSIDVWPSTVGGQDATKNNFGFWRLRTPFIIESAEAFLIRSAKTGSQVGIDATGQVILNTGDRNNLFIGADAINLGDGDQTIFMQLNFNEQRCTIGVGDSRFELSASGESQLACTGSLNVGTSGQRGKGHAITLEQVIALLVNWTIMLAGPMGSSTLASELGALGKLLSTAPTPFPSVLDLAITALLTTQTTPTPPTPTTTGGNFAQFIITFGTPLVLGGIGAALAVPLPTLDPTGFIPGVGRSGFML